MARFRAYASDSSEEDSEQELEEQVILHSLDEDEQEEEDASSSTSDQEEPEPSSPSSPEIEDEEPPHVAGRRWKRPSRNALVEDENGDIRYAHEVDEGRSSLRVSSPSASSPVETGVDPTIIPWAQQVGIDAQKMHVMQTSLFRMPEEAAALKALNQKPPARPNLRLPLQSVNRKHSRDSDGDGFRYGTKERPSFAHDIELPMYRPSRKYTRVEVVESSVSGNEGAIMDAGLALGRSFRVGWGPGGALVHLGSLCRPSSTPKENANSSIVNKTVIPIFPNDADASTLLGKLLQHHLTNTPISPDEDGIPFASPLPSLNFSSFASLFPEAEKSYEASIFRLGQALFDKIDLRLGSPATFDIRSRIIALRRKAALSAWLEDAVSPSMEADLRSNPSAGPIAMTFTLLTGNKVEQACQAALDGGFTKLATLISQAGGDVEYRADLQDQLEIWKDQRIDVHIEEDVRKVYALLAGIADAVIEGSRGGGLEKCSDVDVTKDLDWKRTFGLFLWFSEPADATVADVFHAYTQSAEQQSQRQVAKPLPWYLEQSPSPASSSKWKLPSPIPATDGLYSLIRLHADPACSLSQVLTPLSFSSSPVDYSLPWHLYIILSRCMRLRDFADRGDPGERSQAGEVDDEEQVEGHSPSADLLASSYALQLESLGMIQEALFVLLHIEGSAGRERAIKELLARSAPLLDEWMVRGIVGSLKIPMEWVNEAKALYALHNGEFFEAYQLFLAAGSYNAAHDIAVSELAPDAIICRDLELLESLFNKFLGHPVDRWDIRGKAFVDYVHIITRLTDLEEAQAEDEVPDAAQESEIDELARGVPRLIAILPDALSSSSDLRHRAAVSEMTGRLVSQVDRVRPLLLSQVRPTLLDETTKLSHIHSMAHSRFLRSIA